MQGFSIGRQLQWLTGQLQAAYRPDLDFKPVPCDIDTAGRFTRDTEIRNVMAVLPGRSPRRIYISGHYDTIANAGGQGAANTSAAASRNMTGDPNAPVNDPAPGVNDDGSGTALTMELARVLSQSGIEFDATLVFMCHAAEEMAHFGAVLHAQKMLQQKVPIDAVLNHDIVGGDTGGNGIVDGDLVLVASGDPNLSGRERPDGSYAFIDQDHSYGGQPLPTDPLTVVRDMARQSEAFRNAGVKLVFVYPGTADRALEASATQGMPAPMSITARHFAKRAPCS